MVAVIVPWASSVLSSVVATVNVASPVVVIVMVRVPVVVV